MESIKDMNIFEFDEEFKKHKENSINELMSDANVITVLQQYHADRQFVENHWSDFLDYQEDAKMCENCSGLQECKKVVHGMKQLMEIVDHQVMISSTPCQYGDELLEKQSILSHIPVRNVSDRIVLAKPQDLISLSAKNSEAVKGIVNYIKEPKEYGYYIQGKSQVGKSTLAGFMIRNLANKGYNCGYIHFPTYLLDLKSSFGDNGNSDRTMETLRSLDFLVIDDLGGENITSWSRDEVLASIITYRNQNQRPTIFTSLYTQEELAKLYCLKNKDARDNMKVERLMHNIFTHSNYLHIMG